MSLPLELDDSLVDRNKSALFLHYLGQSAKKIDDKEFAKKKLDIALKQLKKISTKEIEKHIDVLEHHLKDVLHKEKRLLTSQEKEDLFLSQLAKKIDRLQFKLSKYQRTQKFRTTRVHELEDKMKLHLASKQDRKRLLKADLDNLKKLYYKIKRKKGFDKNRLKKVHQRIQTLKEKVAELN